MTDKDKIKQYLDYKGISKSSFYQKTGFSMGFLDSGKSLGVDKAKIIILNYPDLSLEWLVMNKGEMLCSNNGPAIQNSVSENSIYTSSKLTQNHSDKQIEQQRIPLYDFNAVAGIAPMLADQREPEEYISIPNLPKCDGAIYVYGSSMKPLLNSGDIVVFRIIKNVQHIMWGDIYIVSFNLDGDEYTAIKMLYKSENPNSIRLASYNAEVHPVEIPMSSIRQLAHVKASVRYNAMG